MRCETVRIEFVTCADFAIEPGFLGSAWGLGWAGAPSIFDATVNQTRSKRFCLMNVFVTGKQRLLPRSKLIHVKHLNGFLVDDHD